MSKKNIVKVKIEDIKLDFAQDIRPYQTPEQQEEIDKKIEQLRTEGQREAIELDADYKIKNGHLRFFAAKKLGWKEIDATIEPRAKEW